MASMKKFLDIFKRSKAAVIGMVHVRALPGTPHNSLSMRKIIDTALHEAQVYVDAGLDGMIIENMHDLPYITGNKIGPEIVACMSVIASAVKSAFPHLPTGIQILKSGNLQALAVAHSTGCEFIRAECFTFSHISDAGFINASAGELLRYRKQINADEIMIFTDIKKKHSSHAITSDLDTVDAGEAAEFFMSNGVVATGQKTGCAASQKELKALQSRVKIPVLIGSGVTIDNVQDFASANGLIIGSHLKNDGIWSNDLDEKKVKEFMKEVNKLRS